MSAIALQRVVVRMLYDPAFRQRVYANPERALRDVPLTDEERQWLVTPEPRAYGADAHRGSRALTALLEEFPVSGALAARVPRGPQRLHHFFATDTFHQCVQQRGSMAAAFGAYLGSASFRIRKKPPEIAHIAALEMGIAQVRRAAPPPPVPPATLTTATWLGLSPWVVLLTVHPDTLPRYSRLLEDLRRRGGALVEAVLDAKHQLPPGPAFRGQAAEFLLVGDQPGSEGVSLECLSDDLGRLLSAAKSPIQLCDLRAEAERLGGEPEEAQAVITGLVDDRILSPVPEVT